MTVPSEINRAGPYHGNGTTKVFGFGFKIVDARHLRVISRDARGDESTLILNADYTVSGVGSETGGSITTTVAPIVGVDITLLRNVPFVQETDLENQGAYYAETVEDALDLAVMRDQQLKEGLDRAVKVPENADPSGINDLVADIIRLGDSADNIDTVANNVDDVNAVASSIANVNTVANNIAAVNTVATNIADVNTVANIAGNVNTVAGDHDEIVALAAITGNINTVAGIATDVSNVAENADDISTVAENINDVTNFAKVYLGPKANDPAVRNDGSALQEGDLYFNTTTKQLKTFDGAAWQAVADQSLNMSDKSFTGNGSQTDFTLDLDPLVARNVIVWLGGVRQLPVVDYTVSGTTLTFAVAPGSGVAVDTLVVATTSHLYAPADDTVQTSSILGGAVTTPKLGNGAVTREKINSSVKANEAHLSRGLLPAAPENEGFMTPMQTLTMLRNRRPGVYVKEYGAAGDNSGQTVADWIGAGKPYASLSALQVDYPLVTTTNDTKDWAAFSKAISVANALPIPSFIFAEPGYYKLNRALPNVTSNTRIIGGGPRNSILTAMAGSYNLLRFQGNDASRVGYAGLEEIGFFADQMTDGFVIQTDLCQNFTMDKVMCFSPFNFMEVTRCGSMFLENIDIQPVRGIWGVRAYGTGEMTSAGLHKIDIINISNSIFHGTTVAGSVAGTANHVHLDGYVHTLQLNSVALLAGARGLLCTNDNNLAWPFRPSFVFANDLEIENSHLEGIKADHLLGAYFDGLFLVGSQTEAGADFGPGAHNIKIAKADVHGNWKEGVKFRGSQHCDIMGSDFFYNSRAGSGLYSGVQVGEAGGVNPASVTMHGGLAGKSLARPNYTEFQKFGAAKDAGVLKMYGVEQGGNVIGGAYQPDVNQ